MKTKKLFFLLLAFVGLQTFAQSGTIFAIFSSVENATYYTWYSGIRGGGSGKNFTINLNNPLPSHIILEKMEYDGKQTELKTDNGLTYTGSYYYPSREIIDPISPVVNNDNQEKAKQQNIDSTIDSAKTPVIKLYFKYNNCFYIIRRINVTELAPIYYP